MLNPRMTQIEATALEAVRKWITAKEEVLAADEAGRDPVETEHAFAQAEYELTDAAYGLLGREPRVPVTRPSVRP